MKKISRNLKTIKVSGQGCYDDCKRWRTEGATVIAKANGGSYWAGICTERNCTRELIVDAYWSTGN